MFHQIRGEDTSLSKWRCGRNSCRDVKAWVGWIRGRLHVGFKGFRKRCRANLNKLICVADLQNVSRRHDSDSSGPSPCTRFKPLCATLLGVDEDLGKHGFARRGGMQMRMRTGNTGRWDRTGY